MKKRTLILIITALALYAQVEVEREIPEELFAAVAEVLAYVYKMNKN